MPVAGYDSASGLQIVALSTANSTQVAFAVYSGNALRTGTFAQINPAYGSEGADVRVGTSIEWEGGAVCSAGTCTGQPTFSLVLTNVGAPDTVGTSVRYPQVHGTLDATMPAKPGAGTTGIATLHVTF